MRAQAKTQNRKTVLRHGGALSLEARAADSMILLITSSIVVYWKRS